MRPLSITLALLLVPALLPAPAFAADKPAGKVQVEGTVEVPLYGGLDGADPFYYVAAQVGEQTLLLRVVTGHREFRLSKAVLSRIGAKASGPEGAQRTTLAAVSIGAATLLGVKANIAAIAPSGDLPVDGEFGIAAFPSAAWAIVPSTGVLRIAPAGDSLLAAVGSATPFTSGKTKKIKVGSEKEEINGGTYVVEVAWSGVPVATNLGAEAGASWLAREVEGVDWYTMKGATQEPVTLPAAPGFRIGEQSVEVREIALAGGTTTALVRRTGAGPGYLVGGDARVGQDVLGGYDIAVDPVGQRIALKPITASKTADYAPIYEARLRKALEPAAVEAGAEPLTPEQIAAAREAGLGPLADLLEIRGWYDEAVTLRTEAANADANTCAGWLALGGTLLAAGRPADAIEPLTKASDLYLPWSLLALDERTTANKGFAKAEKAKSAWDGPVPQSHACHVAPSALALARIATGAPEAVTALYPARLDLDADLPLAAGSAALRRGDYGAAEAAFRQVIQMESPDDSEYGRLGLFLALAKTDWSRASAQLERARFHRDGDAMDPQIVRAYAEATRSNAGAPAAVEAMSRISATNPLNVTLLTQLGHELAAKGDTAAAQRTFADAAGRLDAELARAPQSGALHAQRAQILLAQGKTEEARAAAVRATELAPSRGLAWLTLSDVETAAGNAAKAAELRQRAAIVEVRNPAYAMLLAK